MTNEQIIEGNKLIADFEKSDIGPLKDKGWLNYCKYHSSWEWLMPVVEQVEGLSVTAYGDDIKYFAFTIQNKYCSIVGHTNIRQPGCYYQTPYGFTPDSKIQATWLAIVEFIKWYNQIK